ncbi:MAG: hypothetical protein NZ957_05025 [Thaumarchaeota archaeon]|nr:hypothetical protein [Candidatus Calditenuaceae archaeon]MDW8042263.1 hypothetical protein [Nitrososphaerota archaeon]
MKRNRFELFTGNIVIGTYRFVNLVLPDGWAVQRSRAPSDVYYTGVVQGKAWVTEGYAHYYLTNLVTGDRSDLYLEVKKGIKGLDVAGQAGLKSFSGHPATIKWRSYATGIFRKREVKEVVITTVCDQTSRTISIQLVSQEELPREVVDTLLESECH